MEEIIGKEDVFSMLADLGAEYNSEAVEQQQEAVLKQLIEMINQIYSEVTAIYTIELKENHFGNQYVLYKKQNNAIRHARMKIMLERLTKFLYLLRTWLTGEKITLRLGGTDIEKKGLAKVDIEQDKWLAAISINISRKAIELSHEVTDLLKQEAEEDAKTGFSNLWTIVKDAADFSGIYDKEIDGEIDGHKFYQKENARDSEVYIRFSGGKSPRALAYYTQQFYYNMGWIYEWLIDLVENTNVSISDLTSYFQGAEHPLAILFYTHKPDSVMSLKGGDVNDFQVKYGNNKLLSFQQLILYIQQMKNIITEYEVKRKGSAQEVIEEIKQLFVQKNQKQIDLSARQLILEDLVEPLKKFAK